MSHTPLIFSEGKDFLKRCKIQKNHFWNKEIVKHKTQWTTGKIRKPRLLDALKLNYQENCFVGPVDCFSLHYFIVDCFSFHSTFHGISSLITPKSFFKRTVFKIYHFFDDTELATKTFQYAIFQQPSTYPFKRQFHKMVKHTNYQRIVCVCLTILWD